MATREEVIEVLKTINDPEILIDIYTLGLIYDIDLRETDLNIRMTFTSIACPVGPYIVQELKDKAKALPGIENVNVEVVFQPPWEPSDELKGMLGIG